MDGRRFDGLVKAAAGGAASRRTVLRNLAGGGVAALVGGATVAPAAAEPVSAAGSDAFCDGKRSIGDTGRCITDQCRGRRSCGCANDVGGKKRCINFLFARCPGRNECRANRECRRGEVCVQFGSCCGNPRLNICVPRCGTETNRAASGEPVAPFAAALAGD